MPENWTAPAVGSPCYLQIPALDLERAQAFYAKVFNWTVQKYEMDAGPYYGFAFPDEKLSVVAGGFHKVDAIKDGEAVKAYLYVDDLEKTMGVIVANGGKRRSEVVPAGSSGVMMEAEDTEGNAVGIYTREKKA